MARLRGRAPKGERLRAGIRAVIEAAGAKLLFLPPYSSDFNPIEMAFSKLKVLRGVEN